MALAEKAARRELLNRVDRSTSSCAALFACSRVARLSCLAISEELLCVTSCSPSCPSRLSAHCVPGASASAVLLTPRRAPRYRSVLYVWLDEVLSMPAGTEFSGLRALAPVPALLSAALFGATFTAWKFEWAVGFLVGLLLQACAACATSLVPAIIAHAVMEVSLDGYRRRRPVPKARPSVEHGLHTS